MMKSCLRINEVFILTALIVAVSLTACGSGGGVTSSHWARSYDAGDIEFSGYIQQTNDGGYILAGNTGYRKAWKTNFLVMKLNYDGSIKWQKIFDKEGYDDMVFSVQQTNEGGYIIAGESFYIGDWNALIIKLNSEGSIIWQRLYSDGGPIYQTDDGGYIVSGNSCIFKIDSTGNIVWQKTYNGGGGFIKQTKDGGYIIERDSGTGKGAVLGEVEVIKLDANGGVMWAKKYEGEGITLWAESIHETTDGGYIFGGTTIIGEGHTSNDLFLVKLDSRGNIIWAEAIGGGSIDSLSSIQLTRDGGYIVVGDTQSFGAGFQDIWVLRLDQNGKVIWQKTYGGTYTEYGESIIETNDGEYVVSGTVTSFGGWDLWVLKLHPDGTISPTAPSYIGADTAAEVKNISISSSDTSVTPTASTVTGSDAFVTSIDANAIVQTQASD